MIERQTFMGTLNSSFSKDVKACCEMDMKSLPKDIIVCSIFGWEGYLFLHVEWEENPKPPEIFLTNLGKCMEENKFPLGQRQWTRMGDIFHYNYPVDTKQWERPQKMTPTAMFGMLKHDKISSYIYYHYQYQEELPGDGDKYGVIALLENMLFMYLEEPNIKEPTVYPGALTTKSSHDNWGERMAPHFIFWEDLSPHLFWRKLICYASMQRE